MNEAETKAEHIDPALTIGRVFAAFQKYLYQQQVAA